MATAYPLPVTAAQVGTYFVGQYYQMLQNQPDFVHQFYSDSSTMLRIEGNTRETASAMLQIHQLVMSLNYTGIEIKTAHSLESWNGGVLVMVLGSVHLKGYNSRKKFVETFFLAPQEKGYFVLNDIFHYVDEELALQHPLAYLPQGNLDQKIYSPTIVTDQVSNYVMGGDIQSREFTSPAKIEENGPMNNYTYQEEHIQQVPETEKIIEENFAVHSNGSIQGTMNSVPGHFSPPVDEPVMEPQKHTYASILQVKGQAAPAVTSQPSFNKPTTPDWQHGPELPSQPSAVSSYQIEKSGTETFDETIAMEDEVEVKSVYVRNVPTTMSASEIGEEFKKFGKLRPDGVAIRTRKDIDVCYAFVEFEDISGVQNAIKASVVNIGGYELYIEGRRPNRNNSIRGGRVRGRGRISYQIEGTRGRFGGRGFSSKESNQDGFERPYSRPRRNGFYKQERPHATSQHGSSNGQHYSE
ncbi:nuclear transport factor 2-like [Salvia hispanica]|uniref:nuclear transport factor 2-like n=1 Tax=Salvia hispanica TaxID=49212 RepID=UPI002008F4FE|nr:nuclear transport factor 2-like [Salvia hispanica]